MKIRIPLYAKHLNQAEFVQLMSITVVFQILTILLYQEL